MPFSIPLFCPIAWRLLWAWLLPLFFAIQSVHFFLFSQVSLSFFPPWLFLCPKPTNSSSLLYSPTCCFCLSLFRVIFWFITLFPNGINNRENCNFLCGQWLIAALPVLSFWPLVKLELLYTGGLLTKSYVVLSCPLLKIVGFNDNGIVLLCIGFMMWSVVVVVSCLGVTSGWQKVG